jgi:hypothetical protein
MRRAQQTDTQKGRPVRARAQQPPQQQKAQPRQSIERKQAASRPQAAKAKAEHPAGKGKGRE